MSLLEVRRLTKTFDGLMAVNDLSFDLNQGEIVALIGPNGAGKTTVFATIAGFLRPTAGTVNFGGKRIDNIKPHEICGLGLARTFQIVQPFLGLKVMENVMVGAFLKYLRRGEALAAASDVLRVVGMSQAASRLAGDLTLPEQKRLEIARALATEPKVILMDEIMAGLRPVEVREMISLLLDLRRKGITFLITEHVMQAVMALADRVIVMHFGGKIAEGEPQEVVVNKLVIEAYLGRDRMIA